MNKQYEKVKEWRRHNKLKLVTAFQGRCACCNLVDDPLVYDFHHVDPLKKEIGIAQKISSWDEVVAEVQKCVMLCVICHRKVHGGIMLIPDDYPRFDENLIAAAGLNKIAGARGKYYK